MGKEKDYGQAASDGERIPGQAVGLEGMRPVSGQDVKDGEYEVKAESSSSMFRIDRAVLTVQDGQMSAVITLSGKGYEKLFLGTGIQAAAGDVSDYIGYVEDKEGKYTYTIPVEALDSPIACAAFSKNKQKWYDRDILFRADSLPEADVLVELPDYEALEKEAKRKRIEAMKEEQEGETKQGEQEGETEQGKKESDAIREGSVPEESGKTQRDGEGWAEPASVDAADGEYWIDVNVQGGAGRASLDSPAILAVREGKAYGQIAWDSPFYDYMKIGEETYFPVEGEGNSLFEIPVAVFDQAIPVIADTTAMSVPHEIEYDLTFYYDSLAPVSQKGFPAGPVAAGALLVVGLCAAVFLRRRKGLG